MGVDGLNALRLPVYAMVERHVDVDDDIRDMAVLDKPSMRRVDRDPVGMGASEAELRNTAREISTTGRNPSLEHSRPLASCAYSTGSQRLESALRAVYAFGFVGAAPSSCASSVSFTFC